MQYKNLKDTFDNKSKESTWKKHWEKYSEKKWPENCVVEHCSNKATLGGHIKKYNSNDRKWYIAPICASCNGKDNEIFNIDSSNVVYANPDNF